MVDTHVPRGALAKRIPLAKGRAELETYQGLDAFPDDDRPVVLSIGNFDGVHAGHQAILKRLSAAAARHGVEGVVLTFDPHPLALLRPEAAPAALTTMSRRVELLAEVGITQCVVYRIGEDLLRMPAETFFEEVICRRLRAVGLVEGPNFHFGRGRQGNVEVLAGWAEPAGMFLEVVPALELAGGSVSSSRIRELLIEGRVREAGDLLTRPHRITGQVVEGVRRGRELGFPTANLEGIEQILPAEGIYAVTVRWSDQSRPGALHLGPRPTFRTETPTVEAHLLDFDGELYAEQMAIDFHHRLRDIRRFDGPEALCEQMHEDIARVRDLLGGLAD